MRDAAVFVSLSKIQQTVRDNLVPSGLLHRKPSTDMLSAERLTLMACSSGG